MTRLQFILLALITFIGSLLGGTLVGSFHQSPVQAENDRNIEAESVICKSADGRMTVVDGNGISLVYQGRTRATIAMNPSGRPEITLLDQSGNIRGSFSTNSNESFIQFNDTAGRKRIFVGLNDEGKSGCALFDPDGRKIWGVR